MVGRRSDEIDSIFRRDEIQAPDTRRWTSQRSVPWGMTKRKCDYGTGYGVRSARYGCQLCQVPPGPPAETKRDSNFGRAQPAPPSAPFCKNDTNSVGGRIPCLDTTTPPPPPPERTTQGHVRRAYGVVYGNTTLDSRVEPRHDEVTAARKCPGQIPVLPAPRAPLSLFCDLGGSITSSSTFSAASSSWVFASRVVDTMASDLRTSELRSPVDLAEYLFRRLHELGVRAVHGVPGDYNLVALDYLEPTGLRWVGNCNELNAGAS